MSAKLVWNILQDDELKPEKCTCDESEDQIEVRAPGVTPPAERKEGKAEDVKGQEVDRGE